MVLPIQRAHPAYDLWAVAALAPISEQEVVAIANQHFPA
jgi:hypothetical protein